MSSTKEIVKLIDYFYEMSTKCQGTEIGRAYGKTAVLLHELRSAREIVTGLVSDYATRNDGMLDSNGMGSMADAIWYLASLDIIEVDHSSGDRVIAKWKEPKQLDLF